MNPLRNVIEQGLDPAPYDHDLTLWVGPAVDTDALHHGDQHCPRTGPTMRATANPTQVTDLCACWYVAEKDSTRVADYHEANELYRTKQDLKVGRYATPLVQLRHYRRVRERLGSDEGNLTSWREELLGELDDDIKLLEDTFKHPSTRGRLRAQCIQEGYGPGGDLLGEKDTKTVGGDVPGVARKVETLLWDTYVHLKEKDTDHEHVVRVLREVLEDNTQDTITASKLRFEPSDGPYPGETLERYVQRSWQHELGQVAARIALDWDNVLQETTNPTDRNLVVVSHWGEDDLAADVVEAWTYNQVGGRRALILPQYALEALQLDEDVKARGWAVLRPEDTDEVVETALKLWDEDGPGPMGTLKHALEAARLA